MHPHLFLVNRDLHFPHGRQILVELCPIALTQPLIHCAGLSRDGVEDRTLPVVSFASTGCLFGGLIHEQSPKHAADFLFGGHENSRSSPRQLTASTVVASRRRVEYRKPSPPGIGFREKLIQRDIPVGHRAGFLRTHARQKRMRRGVPAGNPVIEIREHRESASQRFKRRQVLGQLCVDASVSGKEGVSDHAKRIRNADKPLPSRRLIGASQRFKERQSDGHAESA